MLHIAMAIKMLQSLQKIEQSSTSGNRYKRKQMRCLAQKCYKSNRSESCIAMVLRHKLQKIAPSNTSLTLGGALPASKGVGALVHILCAYDLIYCEELDSQFNSSIQIVCCKSITLE